MDTKKLIENLIAAIEEVCAATDGDPGDHVHFTIEDARETASLAKLVLPTLSTAPPAPVGTFFVLEDSSNELFGPFPDEAAAASFGAALPSGSGYEVYDANDPAVGQGGSRTNTGRHPQPAPAPNPHALPPHAPACSQCSATLDANGDCPDPNCPSNTPAQGYDEMLNGLKAGMPSRPGSVIANKPAGSLYRK